VAMVALLACWKRGGKGKDGKGVVVKERRNEYGKEKAAKKEGREGKRRRSRRWASLWMAKHVGWSSDIFTGVLRGYGDVMDIQQEFKDGC